MANKSIKKLFISFITIIIIITLCFINSCSFPDLSDLFDTSADTDLSGKFAVHFIDVGQGDSILIQTPENDFMLIDTGPGDAYNKLSEYFDFFDVSEFKYAVFTHPHADHIGSADKIIKNYDIETLIMPVAVNTSKTFERLITEIENKNLEITPPKRGTVYQFGGAELIILSPMYDEYENLNNYSVAIKIKYGETTFLLTGDTEKESENEIMDYCNENGLDIYADVLKVAHHGSSTSSQQSFLEFTEPAIAVISCGKDNSYNHPNLRVVERLESIGADILRTDLDGDIIIASDGYSLTVKKGRGDAEEYLVYE